MQLLLRQLPRQLPPREQLLTPPLPLLLLKQQLRQLLRELPPRQLPPREIDVMNQYHWIISLNGEMK